MEKYAMVKTEVQPNGDIFLFYVDENGVPIENNEGLLSSIDGAQLQQLQQNYVIEEIPANNLHADNHHAIQSNAEMSQNEEMELENAQIIQINDNDDDDTFQLEAVDETNFNKERWLDDEMDKLLTFYTDNKEAFLNPAMKKKHLWMVACKTMLIGKNPTFCEIKLRQLKKRFALLYIDQLKNNNDPRGWQFYEQCQEAFVDDEFVQKCIKLLLQNNRLTADAIVNLAQSDQNDQQIKGTDSDKKKNKTPDEQVKQMLILYLKYKKQGVHDYLWQKKVWEKIAAEIGEDAEFWHKRFLNYKQHYIQMLEKRKLKGHKSIIWPYMEFFDEIYKDDREFKQKYYHVGPVNPSNDAKPTINVPIEWNETEKTVLVKYYFDSLDEFHDPSIPNSFLWNEIGRLLDKKPEECQTKYDQMKTDHLLLYLGGSYNLQTRKPVAILFDNILSQEVERECYEAYVKTGQKMPTEQIDEMVQFLFDNIEVFKDSVCHFVCFSAISIKLQKSVPDCKNQWMDLTKLYKSILNEKKEDPDLQIDWRYIDIFDRIFDYGMDTKLLEGYENKSFQPPKPKKIVIGGQASQIKKEPSYVSEEFPDNLSDLEPEEIERKTSGRGFPGDHKLMQILEYYVRYKDKFSTTQRKQLALWQALGKQLSTTGGDCAQKFKNLKQVYMSYIQKELENPDKPILWPYYALCKKAFGYRVHKNKLRQAMADVVVKDGDDWALKDIKILISHFGTHFKEIEQNPEDITVWAPVAVKIDKSETICRDKFLELLKSYKRIKMMNKTPDCKVNWKYYKHFEEVYSNQDAGYVTLQLPSNAIKTEIQDDDLQCIIVIPEGGDATDLNNANITNNPNETSPKDTESKKEKYTPWKKSEKIQLLKLYQEYLQEHKGQVIEKWTMYKEIGEKLHRSPSPCRAMFTRILKRYRDITEDKREEMLRKSSMYRLMKCILAMNAKFVSGSLSDGEIDIREQATYTDVNMPLWKLEKALKYYLEHVEEFVNPKYDKKFVWINLAKEVDAAPNTVFRKINYLKQYFISETNEVKGRPFEFADILKEILEKEFICKIAIENMPEPMQVDENEETIWSEDEIECLLRWYLENLDKFKNPKFVPSYLWMEAASVLNKPAISCSSKMSEIRSQYSLMVKENPEALNGWRFFELCQKIYGTGKKPMEQDVDSSAS